MSVDTKTVFVGLSGGVDSSVSAYLLQQAGYQVVGVYMKNWTTDIGDHRCPWRTDYLDAKRLATFLKIDFLEFDFREEYKRQVVDYMIGEYRRGNTPNPDIWCNQAIKFDLFLKTCLAHGADLIATGHYAQVKQAQLYQAFDQQKDQTYFLYRMPQVALTKTLFPLGTYLKSQVRQLAATAKLPNATRAESMGICFVGEVGLADFLSQYLVLEPGEIIDDETQAVVGQHKGAALYTLGQRHGLAVGGGLPYYVISKDLKNNRVYVSRNLDHPALWSQRLSLREVCDLSQTLQMGVDYQVRIRHGGGLLPAVVAKLDKKAKTALIELQQSVRAATTGQSAVLYQGDLVVGGGIISD